jgi:pilus assembly protein Flp/PilA
VSAAPRNATKTQPQHYRFSGRVGSVSVYPDDRVARVNHYLHALWDLAADEAGQDVVEYGLLIATIAIVVLIGVGFFGSNINAWFQNLAGRITTTGT